MDIKTIIKYLVIFALLLCGGALIKDVFAVSIAALIGYYAISKNFYKSIELLLIWLFIYNFFLGQGYVTNEILLKYLVKPQFLLFLIFLFFWNDLPSDILKSGYLKAWLFFILISFLSAISQNQSPFVIITISSFFIFYLLFQTKQLNTKQYNQIINLLITAAILQTIVSFLQVSEIIPPSSKMMGDGEGGQFEWVAGLDDVASGTFGPGASFIASWYAALISLLLFLAWVTYKKASYFILMIITFLQFATTDSKIIVLVTSIMFIYLMFYLFKKRVRYKIRLGRYVFLIILISIGAFGFYKIWDKYYEYYGEKTGGQRSDINTLYELEGKESIDLLINNIGDWGKIRGYQYITNDFIENNEIQLIWGYGIQGYAYNGKMSYIESKDTPIMQLNNLTNSRSGLITQFATSGFIGFILIVLAITLWYKTNNKPITNYYDKIKDTLLKVYLPFSVLAAFLYSIDITSIPIIIFAIIISIYIRLSALYVQRSIKTKQNEMEKLVSFV